MVLRTLVLAALFGWFIWLRPQALGGGASFIVVSGTSMEPVYHAGDLVIVERSDTYRQGDIVAYKIPAGEPAAGFQVIHRIIGGDAAQGFLMRGDNTNGPDQWHPQPSDVLGRELVFIPGAARLLLLMRNPLLLGALAAAFVTAWIMLPGARPRRPEAIADDTDARPAAAEPAAAGLGVAGPTAGRHRTLWGRTPKSV